MRFSANGPRRAATIGLVMFVTSLFAAADETAPCEFFEAIADGTVRAQYIARNAHEGTLQIENLFPEAIVIRLPEAFGARPVLGQFGGPGMAVGMGQNAMGQNGMGNNGGGQQVGGNFGNRGGGNQNGLDFFGGKGFGGNANVGGGNGANRMMGGLMRIGPRGLAKRSAQTVCLQYGRPDPRPRMRYEIVPIETLASDPVVARLCSEVGSKSLSSDVAQAIAWHRMDAMDFATLADLPRHRSRYLRPEPMFDDATLSDVRSWLYRCLGSLSHGPPVEVVSLAGE